MDTRPTEKQLVYAEDLARRAGFDYLKEAEEALLGRIYMSRERSIPSQNLSTIFCPGGGSSNGDHYISGSQRP